MLRDALGAISGARRLLGVVAILAVGSAWIAGPHSVSDLHVALWAGVALLAAGRLALSAFPGAARRDGRAGELALAGASGPQDVRSTGLARPNVAFTTGSGDSRPGAVPRKADAQEPAAEVEDDTGGPRAQGGSAPDGAEGVLVGVRSRMDEISYRPGKPNVLSMTKFVRNRGSRAAVEARGAAGAARAAGTCLSVRNGGAETVLVIEGMLDVVTAPEVRAAVEALIEERRTPIAVELSSLERMDGAGARVLARLFEGCSAFGGTVRVTGAKEQPLAILRLLRLDRIFGL